MQFSMQTPMTRVEEQGLLGFLRYRSEAKTSVVPIVSGERIQIGSSVFCDVIIDDPHVQGLHCTVFSDSNKLGKYNVIYLKDHSRNGTFLGGYLIGTGRSVALYERCKITIVAHPYDFEFIPTSPCLMSPTNCWKSNLSVDEVTERIVKTQPMNVKNGRQIILCNQSLGSGKQSIVELAYFQHAPSRQLACKIYTRFFALKSIPKSMRKIREVEILRICRHPNIIPLVASDIVDTDLYIITRLATGGSLQDLLDDHENGLNEDLVLHIFMQLVLGLQYLHSDRLFPRRQRKTITVDGGQQVKQDYSVKKPIIIHGDLKPENILLCERNVYPRVMISDFGVSVFTDQIKDLLVVGTDAYKAPEIMKEEFDETQYAKADCWALGVILYQLLCGKYPFDELNVKEAIKNEEPTYEEPTWQHVSEKAKHVVQGLLQKNPYERLSTAQVCQTDWVSEYLIKSGFLEFLRKQWNEFMREEKVFRRIEVLERAKTLTRSVAEPQVRAPGRPFRRKLTKDEDKLIQRVSAQLR